MAKKSAGGLEFADWYTQACTVAELISYYDVSGAALFLLPSFKGERRGQGRIESCQSVGS